MIYLAYDGSINSEWIARYCLELAHTQGSELTTLYVRERKVKVETIQKKMDSLSSYCKKNKIQFHYEILEPVKSVFQTLVHRIPQGADNLVVCGTRVRAKKSGYISGTISEKLLRYHKFPVLAIRVVHPGILGNPKNILMAVSGKYENIKANLPLLSLLLEHAHSLTVVRVMEVTGILFRYMRLSRSRALRKKGLTVVKKTLEEIRQILPKREDKSETLSSVHSKINLDMRIEVCNDWVAEVLIQAGKLKSDFILLGATEKILPARFFYGNRMERFLRDSPCDVGVYRAL